MSRYQLALPFLAISEGSNVNVCRESAIRSRGFRGSLVIFALAQLLCGGMLSATLLYGLRLHFRLYDPISIGAGAVAVLCNAIVMSWFLLVRTGVALQVFGRMPPAERQVP